MFNLFNPQEQLDIDENYTYDAAHPIIGGTFEDLEHVKTLDPATGQELEHDAIKNKNFGNTTCRTSPAERTAAAAGLAF